jgi:CIC family chloride channel protein
MSASDGPSGLAAARGSLRWLSRPQPVELALVGRTLWRAALVGLAAGLLGAGFFWVLEWAGKLMMEDLAGYQPLRAEGERFVEAGGHRVFRPWVIVILPAIGGLLSGLVSRLAPETRGGGGDATIDAYHRHGAHIRRRVIPVKMLATTFTLASGGSGGREGPIMQIGGALGALVARLLHLGGRERRLLLVAGMAAGMSAIFRTPLGAALLAVEVLYRDDFEAEALVPAVLASVLAYAVVVAVYGEASLFGRLPRHVFVPLHLPLFGLLGLVIAPVALAFVAALHTAKRLFARLPGPDYLRPAVGGLLLGVLALPFALYVSARLGVGGQGAGLLGNGYGAVQAVISSAKWLPTGWGVVGLLVLFVGLKIVATSFTAGSGASAGEFAPSLVIGGVLGGAFGQAALLLTGDPRIDPAAYALVGMGAFYGGIAHVPISALILVSELAGSYDLLVPMMLSVGVAYLALRRRSLYHAQLPSRRHSPVHRAELDLGSLGTLRVVDLIGHAVRPAILTRQAQVRDAVATAAQHPHQEVFPVVDDAGVMVGLVTTEMLVHRRPDDHAGHAHLDEMMLPATAVRQNDDLRQVASELVAHEFLHEIPVIDEERRPVALVTEADLARGYLRVTAIEPGAERSGRSGLTVVLEEDVIDEADVVDEAEDTGDAGDAADDRDSVAG